MKNLNIFRIMLFAIVLLVLHILNGALVPTFRDYEEPDARAFWLVTGYLVQAVMVIVVFARLARIQVQLPYVHAVCVFVLCELFGLVVLFVLAGNFMMSSLTETVIDYIVLSVWAIIGVEIGRRLRAASDREK